MNKVGIKQQIIKTNLEKEKTKSETAIAVEEVPTIGIKRRNNNTNSNNRKTSENEKYIQEHVNNITKHLNNGYNSTNSNPKCNTNEIENNTNIREIPVESFQTLLLKLVPGILCIFILGLFSKVYSYISNLLSGNITTLLLISVAIVFIYSNFTNINNSNNNNNNNNRYF